MTHALIELEGPLTTFISEVVSKFTRQTARLLLNDS